MGHPKLSDFKVFFKLDESDDNDEVQKILQNKENIGKTFLLRQK